MRGFIEFVKNQGVIGLAVGFILSTQISNLVNAIVMDLINPLLGIFIGTEGNLDKAYFAIGKAHFMWGHLLNAIINFLILAFLIYLIIRVLRLEEHLKKQ